MDEHILIQWYDEKGFYDGPVMAIKFVDREELRRFIEKLERSQLLYAIAFRSDTYSPSKVD